MKDPQRPILSKTIKMDPKRTYTLPLYQHKVFNSYLCVGVFHKLILESYGEVRERVERDWNVLFEFLRQREIQVIRKVGNGENLSVRVSCPFHPPDHHSSGSFKRGNTGDLIYRDFHDGNSYVLPEFAYFLKHKIRMGKDRRREKYTDAVIDIAMSAGVFTKNSFKKLKLAREVLKKLDKLPLSTCTKDTLKLAYSAIAEVAVRFSYLDDHREHFFLSCRQLAEKMKSKDVAVANKAINFLCILGVLRKLPKEKGARKADIFQLRDVPIAELKAKVEVLKDVTLASFSRKYAAKVLYPEEVKTIFRQNGPAFRESTDSDKKARVVAMAVEIFDGEIVRSR